MCIRDRYQTVESVTSCASCHTSGAAGAPRFKGIGFLQFINQFGVGDDSLSRTLSATQRVINRLRRDSSDVHFQDIQGADILQAELETSEDSFNACLEN